MKNKNKIPHIEGESLGDYEKRFLIYINEKYGEGVVKAREDLGDDMCFLGTYRTGTLKSYNFSLQELKDYLSAAKLMSKEQRYEKYHNGIKRIISDLSKIRKKFKCDIKSLDVDSVFFTGQKVNAFAVGFDFDINKYKVIKKTVYENWPYTRTVFKVQALDRKGITVVPNSFWLFTEDELVDIAYDNEEEVYAEQEKYCQI